MAADSESAPSVDQHALIEIARGTAATTGGEFFAALVRHLALALHTKCAWVTEWLEEPRRLRALAFWVDGHYVAGYEYPISGTPCEPVIDGRKLIVVADRVIDLYATDPDLGPLGAVSYMGQPLFDTDGRILGHLAVLDDKPMRQDPAATAIFNIFSARAAAELARDRRDCELREREDKLARLIASAMDAIIELDANRVVTRVNEAAERIFGLSSAEALGSSVERLFVPASHGRLIHLTRELARRPQTVQSLWIPDGLEGKRTDGTAFPAEATLSRFEAGGHSFFTLILRNIDDRIDAERRIRSLRDEAEYLRAEIDSLQGFDEILGESEAVRVMLADVNRVADSDTTVLISGETGTGKELIARAIHRLSPRNGRPLVKVNCAAIPTNLQESEFFGHERGAFAGATQRREGRFRLADGGTIFLDEVGEMPLDLQPKLLRVLQEGEFERVGSSKSERVDVRVLAATNRELEQMVREGSFRRDLLYRLNVFPVRVPPLRQRGNDVVLLAEAFLAKFARRRGVAPPVLMPTMKARQRRYEWPGNVRELENVIERALIISRDGRTLDLDRALPDAAFTADVDTGATAAQSATDADRVLTASELAELERANLLRALAQTHWKLSGPGGAAQLLGVHPSTLASRVKALGLRKPSSA